MTTLQPHKLASLFPAIPEEEFNQLVQDIRSGGLLEPIWLYEGKVLDGWHRYRAAKKAGVEPRAREWRGRDPLAFVVSMNVMRRHLNKGQRALLLVQAAEQEQKLAKRGGQSESAETADLSTEAIAKTLNVSERVVSQARRVAKEPELPKLVLSGRLGLDEADEIAPIVAREKDPKKRERIIEHQIRTRTQPSRPRPTAKYMGPKRWDDVPAVKVILVWLQGNAPKIRGAKEAADVGKYSPEAARFVAKRLREQGRDMLVAADYIERKSK